MLFQKKVDYVKLQSYMKDNGIKTLTPLDGKTYRIIVHHYIR